MKLNRGKGKSYVELEMELAEPHTLISANKFQNRCLGGRFWCIKDICGMFCAFFTWLLIFYAEFVVMYVILFYHSSTIYAVINGVIFQSLAILAISSHIRTMLTDPGAVPRGNATKENIQRMGFEEGQVIFKCPKCCSIKPDRAHHCSVCQRCIKKMDHHCPWVNNCVAFNNYKFFMLFLGYALTYTVFLACCVFRYFVQFWTDGLSDTKAAEGQGKFHVLFLFFVSVMFCISVSSLFWYHVYLVLQNRSTLEQFRAPYFATGPDEAGWSLGKRNNFQEVFGDRVLYWFLPIETTIGDGLTFPTRINSANLEANYQSTGQRPPLVMASPAANAVRGRSKDISYIDEDNPTQAHHGHNGVKHTEVILDTDERIQVKVSKLPKHDLMHH